MGDKTPVATFSSVGPKDTQHLGFLLGKLLGGGEVIGLIGELGAGKTCFVKGVAQGIHISPDEVTSPTFTLIHEHIGKRSLAHVDLFRLEQLGAIESLGLVDYFSEDWVTVIEWAERALPLLPAEKMLIRFEILSKEERVLRIEPMGGAYFRLMQRWMGSEQAGVKRDSGD